MAAGKSIEEIDILKLEKIFTKIYKKDRKVIEHQFERYKSLIQKFHNKFDNTNIHLFSTPGRTEIGGNHTDHNHGRVLAASVNLDIIGLAAPTDDNKVTVYSEGYSKPFEVNLRNLHPDMEEAGQTTALIKGITARFEKLGYNIGGFNAYLYSEVRIGSGLSSSASIEVMIGTIINTLFNDERVAGETVAEISKYAENVYFNKPCGLMDQLTCAIGGIILIDFMNPQIPLIKKIDFDLSKKYYSLLVVDTGGSHADFTEDYSLIPEEMESVAMALGGEVCRDISLKQILESIRELRSELGDRAILRALHFQEENERVLKQVRALEQDDFDNFLQLVNESGSSSARWLQNSFSIKNPAVQGINLALAVTEQFIKSTKGGACRVHGGGFAGTIQVFIPNEKLDEYINLMEGIFGENSVSRLSYRPCGSLYLNSYL